MRYILPILLLIVTLSIAFSYSVNVSYGKDYYNISYSNSQGYYNQVVYNTPVVYTPIYYYPTYVPYTYSTTYSYYIPNTNVWTTTNNQIPYRGNIGYINNVPHYYRW